MNNLKFWSIYHYQNEIFSIIIDDSSTTTSSLNLTDFLCNNYTIPGTSNKLYKYAGIGSKYLQKYGATNDFQDYLFQCSTESPISSTPCMSWGNFILKASLGFGIYADSSNSFYGRYSNPNLSNFWTSNGLNKDLDCVYQNGILSSSFFIKDLNLWKYEYIDYQFCFQDKISTTINSILNFNKFDTSINKELSSISYSSYVNGKTFIHSFLRNSDYNRKNLLKKVENLASLYIGGVNSKIIDYSISPIGSKILEGQDGRNIHIQYFNPVPFYNDTEINSFYASYNSRPLYLKNEETIFASVNDQLAYTSDAIVLPPAKFDSQGFPIKRYVKVTKLSHETSSTLLKKDIQLEKINEITSNKFSYPFSAVAATKIDSRSMSSLPTRTYDCKLKKILIPSNYYPLDDIGRDVRYSQSRGSTMIYKEPWDGSFKLGWTDNPAWILMDLLINKRYGLGNYIESNQIDIWELYQIAKWCDACDKNGIFWGVPDSYSGYEPRHTFNALIIEKYNVYDLINNIMSLFKGSVYYSNSLISFDDDRLKEISGIISSKDIRDGTFNFGNFRKDEEFTAIEISYLDRRDSYKPKTEYVEDIQAIKRRGVLKKQVSPIGITSRGQAIRYAKHILFQTAKETSSISFSIDSKILIYDVGDLIKIDPIEQEKKQFGKIFGVKTVS